MRIIFVHNSKCVWMTLIKVLSNGDPVVQKILLKEVELSPFQIEFYWENPYLLREIIS